MRLTTMTLLIRPIHSPSSLISSSNHRIHEPHLCPKVYDQEVSPQRNAATSDAGAAPYLRSTAAHQTASMLYAPSIPWREFDSD